MTAYVGGVTAARTDLSLRIADRLLPFILGVATLSFLLLMVAYRSLVIPAKAAAMNLLSISAAYGVVVAVFQWGWGAQLIGLDGPVPIESYVPMMMFADPVRAVHGLRGVPAHRVQRALPADRRASSPRSAAAWPTPGS